MNYGTRADGTEKGLGFFGELQRPDGSVSTELSIGVNLNGRETEIPLLVPTLTREELDYLLQGGEPTRALVDKAVQFAQERAKAGKDFFAGEGEQVSPPPSSEEGFRRGFDRINGQRVPNQTPVPNTTHMPPPIFGVRG